MDLDQNFREYLMQWLKENEDAEPSDLEEQLPALYEKWKVTPLSVIDGLTPMQYYKRFSAHELCDMLKKSFVNGKEPSSLLTDYIAQTRECEHYLVQVLKEKGSQELKMTAINLLTEMGAEHPLNLYIDWLKTDHMDDLLELAVEVMCENATAVQHSLYEILPQVSLSVRTVIAEILVNAPQDERTYNLLCELFASGDNIPLYAGYIGKYGDERAAAMLYRALNTCNYMEYIEIKNAIERMGGLVEDERDFTDDVYYKAIKNLK